ncbi:hypothetical protein U9M48_005808 [Paspalum notatum var. saurae]|uniref:Uncharacterized protein n=1 Tax=Paspalum notatum var. saurae TaxID=547442 RepID=A0AAQ3PQW8_PASNO
MGTEASTPDTTQLDLYIYDYLVRRNLITTAKIFVKETGAKTFATDIQKIDFAGGLLSDWWSIFWPNFIMACPELSQGHAIQQTPLEVGEHSSHPVTDSPQVQSHQFHQPSGIGRMDLPNSTVYNRTAPRHMQQPYQQPADGKCAADMLDLSGGFTMKKKMGIVIDEGFNLKASAKKLFCCDFSLNGELLASAGDENKVFIWNLKNNLEQRSWEAHSRFITDISFCLNGTMLATASSDKTVRLWDISQGDYCIQTMVGHSTQVKSVDFHPRNPSVLCSCDDGGRIFFWRIGQFNPHMSQVAGKGKVRFHPNGDLLASAIDSTVSIIDVEKDEKCSYFQGNTENKPVRSISWNNHFQFLACVSEDCAKIWSPSGEVRELSGKQRYFRSCSFHPKYPDTLVIGGYKTITLWNFAENKEVSVQPHDCYVSDLAECLPLGLLASASHDGCVKVWN